MPVDPGKELTAKNYKIFKVGDAFHDLIKGWIRENGLLIDYRKPDGTVPVNWFTKQPDPEFPCSSEALEIPKAKIDGIGIFNGKLWIYEFKSINDGGFNGKKYPSGFVVPPLNMPKDEHLRQAMLYAYLLEEGLENGDYSHIKELEGITEVEGVIYLYINKNDSEIKEFKIKKDMSVFEGVVKDIVAIQEYNEQGKLPPKTKIISNCKFCDFAKRCEQNKKAKS
jgi:hypothetical protein